MQKSRYTKWGNINEGVYDLIEYTRGFYDEQVYYNSPIHYIPNLTNPFYLDKLKASHHIHIYTGSGEFEEPDGSRRFASVLFNKGIWCDLDVWGPDIRPWRIMFPYILDKKF